MRISDWSSDVCSSDLAALGEAGRVRRSLSSDERARFDAAAPRVFEVFGALSAAWRALRVGEALVLEWPTLERYRYLLPSDRGYHSPTGSVPSSHRPSVRSSEERRVGKEVVRPCSTLGVPYK